MAGTTGESYTGDVKDVRTIATLDEPGPYDKIWQPYVIAWDEGHYIAAYGCNLRGKVDMGDMVASVSTSSGDSWSPPIPIFDHRATCNERRYAYANPALYRAPGQRVVWCFAMRCPLHFRDSEASELCAAYTSDGGYSWIQVELSNHFDSPLITCNSPLMHRGRFLLPVHRNTMRRDPYGDGRQFVLESTDLLSWNLAGYVPFDEGSPVFLHEASIAEISGGTLALVMRTATYGHRNYRALDNPVAYRSASTDGGRTWSTAEPVPGLHNTCSKAQYLVDRDGREIYVYSPGPLGERKALNYVTKPPGGTWGSPRVFYDGGNRNSYPTLVEAPEGESEYLCIWDSSNDPERKRTTIRFGRFAAS